MKFLNLITNSNSNVDFVKLWDRRLMFEFGTEMYCDENALGRKVKDISSVRLLEPPAIIAGFPKEISASKSKTLNPTELKKDGCHLIVKNSVID